MKGGSVEPVQAEKKLKVSKSTGYSSIRVKKETRRKILQELSRVNKKNYGKKVRVAALIEHILNKLTETDIQLLQEGSLSNGDKFQRNYEKFVAQYGAIPKDEYLGLILRASQETLLQENVATTPSMSVRG